MSDNQEPQLSGLDLIIKSETVGLDSEEEAIALAKFLVQSGLVNSTGSYQRFVRDIVEEYGEDVLS